MFEKPCKDTMLSHDFFVFNESKTTGLSPILLSVRFIHFVLSLPDKLYMPKGSFIKENHLEFGRCA